MDQGTRIGNIIRTARRARHLSQAQLADLIGDGARQQHVDRWERGALPAARWLTKIAAALDIDVAEMLGSAPGQTPDDLLECYGNLRAPTDTSGPR